MRERRATGFSAINALPVATATAVAPPPPPAPVPTAASLRVGVTAPNNGSGGDSDSGIALGWLLVAGFVAAGAALTGGSLALKRR